jgi:trans-aconitate 2-methyltransferase
MRNVARPAIRDFVFQKERTLPAVDLLNRIPRSRPRKVIDLGCGPGYTTALLTRRFPQAEIVGIDLAEDALELARARLPKVQFAKFEIGSWTDSGPYDLIFSNGALQWAPRHHVLLPKLLASLALRGRLALQIPSNWQEPNRALMRMVAVDGPWAKKLLPIAKTRSTTEAFESYYALLRQFCRSIDIWQTTYVHPLDGVQSIVEWMKATGLGPFLNPLDDAERRSFIEAYTTELTRAYPVQPDGTVLLRFPRLFILARS